MTAAQYRAACKSLGLSPAYGAAAALGISIASAQRYAKGTWPVPETVARLLWCYEQLGYVPEQFSNAVPVKFWRP